MSEFIEIPYGSNLQLGHGYDLLSCSPRNSPFNSVQKTSVTGKKIDTRLSYVETASQISQFLSIDASGSFNLLFVSGSTSERFLKEAVIDDYSLMFVVHIHVETGFDIINSPKLSQTAAGFVAAKNFEGFKAAYGDYYLSSVTKGGDMVGLIRITTRSVKERAELKAALNTSGLGWQVQAELQNKISQHVSSKNIDVKFWASGVQDANPPNTVAELLAFAKAFPDNVVKGNVIIRAELQPMSTHPEYQTAVALLSPEVREVLDRLSLLLIEYSKLRDNLAYMLSEQGKTYFDWDSTNRDAVALAKDKADQQIRTLKTLATQVLSGAIKPSDPRIINIVPAYRFDDNIKLPYPVLRVTPQDTTIFPLSRHTRGDKEMGGHSPITTISASLAISDDKKRLLRQTYVKIQESQDDWTTFEDSRKDDIIVDMTGTGYKIVSFFPTSGQFRWQAAEDQHKWTTKSGAGLIKSARCLSDTDNEEAGSIGVKPIEWAAVKVVVAQ